mgnify:CR=1 FL=1
MLSSHHLPSPAAPAAPGSRALISVFLVASSLGGCALDALFLNEATRKGHQLMPEPAPVRVTGHVPELPGARVRWLNGEGAALSVSEVTANELGDFQFQLDGTTELRNSVIEARLGARQALGLLPLVPAQTSVLDPILDFDTAELSPGLHALDLRTTTLTLLAVGRARSTGQALAAIPATGMTDTLIGLHQRLVASDAKLQPLEAMVGRLITAADPTAGADGIAAFTLKAGPSLLDADFLAAGDVDYTGDGTGDLSTAAFDAALAEATASFEFKACYVPQRIKVILLARLAAAAKNTACDAYDPFQWSSNGPGKRMFVVGGVHKDTPACSPNKTTDCLTAAQIDALNATLGGWVPNKVPMYDDGGHGDAVAGDGVWTLVFESPWWPVVADGAGVRLAYKFTWGKEGQGWTDAEEFPGNQRLLELADVNGDHLIVRFDHFADEAGNKDKKNLLPPSMGNCGVLTWPQDTPEGCRSDAREREVDLDGDCEVDGWPSAGPNAPLTVPCPQ